METFLLDKKDKFSGKTLPPNPAYSKTANTLYHELSQEFKLISAGGIYSYLTKKENATFKEKLGVISKEKQMEVAEEEENYDMESDVESENLEEVEFSTVERFATEISSEEFLSFGMALRCYKNQNRWRPAKGWTTKLFDMIADDIHLSCPITFRYGNRDIFATGQCSDSTCPTKIKVLLKETDDKKVKLEVRLYDYNKDHPHQKSKRQTRKREREEIRRNLETENPFNLYNRMRAEAKSKGWSKEPPNLPILPTIQKINRELNPSASQIISNLYEHSQKFPFIREIHLIDELRVVFFSNSQYNLFNNYSRDNETIMSVDDTGNLVYNLNGRGCGNFNLFVTTLRTKDKSYPMIQMLSSRKNAESVGIMFGHWLRYAKKPPNTLCGDGAGALHLAGCRSFNKVTLLVYMSTCWRILQEGGKFPFPTVIRMDRVHFIKMVVRFFKKNLPKNHKIGDKEDKEEEENSDFEENFREAISGSTIVEFYGRVMGLLVDLTDFAMIVDIMGSMLFISICENESALTIKVRQFLERFIKGEKVECPVKFSHKPQKEWFKVLQHDLKKVEFIQLGMKNPYFFPKMLKYVSYVADRLLLWSPLVSKLAGTKTNVNSMDVESFFNVLKNKIMKKVVKHLDDFIASFHTYLGGALAFESGENYIPYFSMFII